MARDSVLAFVLGGGGARGALQVGALRALFEVGLRPDLLVGTSIGAANAAFFGLHCFTAEAMDALEVVWYDAARRDLLPDNYVWLTIRALFNRPGLDAAHRIRDFFVGHGLDPGLTFGQLPGPRLILVAADLRGGCVIPYGVNPGDSVLNAVLASTAIPPWVRPRATEGRLLMDGGVVSNLPIEPALLQGATEIVALDLSDPRPVGLAAGGLGPFLFQLISTVEMRQRHLEIQLAAAHGVPVHHLELLPSSPVGVWEFARSVPLLKEGYELAQRYLAEHPELGKRKSWWQRLWPRGRGRERL